MMNRYEKYKDSSIPWIGEIPQDWELNMLSRLFNEHKQKNVDLKETNLLSLSYGRIIRKDINTNEGLLPQSFDGYNILSEGDIVFRLTDLQNDKRSLRTGLVKEAGIITSAYITIRNRKNLDSSYFHYLFHSYDLCKVFYGLGDGVRQGMNFADLKWIPIVIPKLEEQRAIADFLDVKCAEVDELIALQGKMIDELKVYKQSVITEAVTKGLNSDAPLKDSGIEWIGKIPQHWSVERLKNRIYKLFAGIWGDDAQNNVNDVRCYRVADFDYNQLNISDDNPTKRNVEKSIFEQRKVSFDDILLEKSGGGEKSPVGRAVYVNLKEDAICSNFVHCIKVDKTLTSKFLVYVLCNMYNRKVNLLYFNQTTGIQNLNVSNYLNNKVGFPPLEEQQQIADYLDTKCAEIDEMTSIKQQKIEQLKEYKKSIIYEYVTGKKQVNIE